MKPSIYHKINQFTETGKVHAGISLRVGGVSEPPYDSLNLASHVGDNPTAIIQNSQIFSNGTGINSLKSCNQIHSDIVINATQLTSTSLNGDKQNSVKTSGDALISAQQGDTLGIFTADCVPIFILDVTTPAIGIVHAGWRGTLAQIATKTLKKMKTCFGTIADNCLIHLGPSIQECCYSVSKDLITEFSLHFGENVHNGLNLSLQNANYSKLVEAGIAPASITISPMCTACSTDLFYSYRAEDGDTGRMLSFIRLNKTE